MANLGTLDTVSRNGYGSNPLDTFNQNLAKQISVNGSDNEKIAYLLGSYLGNYFGRARRKKDNEKFDNIINQAKANPNDPGFVSDENGIRTTNAPQLSNQDYNYIINGSMNGGDPVISSGVDAQELLTRPAADYGKFEQAKPVQQAFNPNYNEQYLRNEARRQGISSSVVNQRMAETRADIAQTADAGLLPDIQKNLYGYTDDKGNRIAPTIDTQLTAMSQLNELEKYSPDTAKAYKALALQGLQGDANFARQKELAQIKANDAVARANQNLQNRIAYRQATAGLGKSYQTKPLTSKERVEFGEKYAALGEELRAKYGSNPLPKDDEKVQLYFEIENILYPKKQSSIRLKGTAPNVSGEDEKPSDMLGEMWNSIDFANYDKPDEIAEGKKYTFIQGTQSVVDAMRKQGAKDDEIFKTIDGLLAKQEKAGNLPAGYREHFAHSMSKKTDREIIDEAIKKKEADALALDKTLNPQKYGIDPMQGTRDGIATFFRPDLYASKDYGEELKNKKK